MQQKNRYCDNRTPAILLAALGLFIAGIWGCSAQGTKEFQLSADSPSPSTLRFEAGDLGLDTDPRYNEIIVYDTTACTLPECPIVWHVLLPDNSGPSEFIYGGVPTFGSQTIVPAKPLFGGRTYELRVGSSDPRFPHPSGRLSFQIGQTDGGQQLKH